MNYKSNDHGWVCQNCGGLNDPDGSFCRDCGARRPGSNAVRGASDSKPAFCPCCGEAISDSAMFCVLCGARISDYLPDNDNEANVIESKAIDFEIIEDEGTEDFGDEEISNEEETNEGFDDKTEVLGNDEDDSAIMRLRWDDNNGNEDIIVITCSPFVVGRSDKEADRTIDARGISHRHFFIDKTGADYYITDNNSTNGVKVNGIKIKPMSRTHIKDGDVIGVGEREYTFEKLY